MTTLISGMVPNHIAPLDLVMLASVPHRPGLEGLTGGARS
jgi:hypothetical protein